MEMYAIKNLFKRLMITIFLFMALPSFWNIRDGIKDIPIEERDANEVNFVQGKDKI